ncbi:MAG: ComEC/Rec2 family competence protein [Pirellulaceae bacterium]|nr:ComEC/Rec2 family competence protein [Pirellulaceae bacterium]
MPNGWISPFFSRPSCWVVVLFTFSGGILADYCLEIACEWSWSIGLLSLMGGWGSCRSPKMFTGLILLAIACCGAGWHHLYWNFYDTRDISRYATGNLVATGIPISVRATVENSPVFFLPDDPIAMTRTQFRVRAHAITGPPQQLLSGTQLVTVLGQLTGIRAGDDVQITGRLRAIPSPKNPGERDRARHFRAQRQLSQLEVPHPECVVLIRHAPGFRHWLAHFRGWCSWTLRQYLPHETAPTASALLLGQRGSLTTHQRDSFFRTGTMHLLVVSGLHVGIVASLILFASRVGLLPGRHHVVYTMVLVACYAVLAEARPPVLRACLLIQIVCFGWLNYRRIAPFNSLSVAALVILLRNPCELFQIGTQLSFLAVTALSIAGKSWFNGPPQDPLDRLIWRRRSMGWKLGRRVTTGVASMLLASTMVWLVTLPLVAKNFHIFCPISILLSVVLWLPIAISLYSALGVLILHVLFPPLAVVSGSLCGWQLQLLLGIVAKADEWPCSHYWLAGPGISWICLFYSALMVLICHPTARNSRRAWLLFGTFFLIVFVAEAKLTNGRKREQLRCTIISVGHGSCVLLEFPDGTNTLYDAGKLGASKTGIDIVSRLLWSRGISRIDSVIVSHADLDHYNLVPEIIDRFAVRAIYTSPHAHRRRPALHRLHLAAAQHGVEWNEIQEGDLFLHENCRVKVLHPPPVNTEPNHQQEGERVITDNEMSIVLQIDYCQRTILLPGDIEKSGLERLLNRYLVDVDVLLSPHHGSQNSSPDRFADWCVPEWIIISSGNPASYHSHQSISERLGCQIFHTAIHGAIEITADADRLRVCGFLSPTARPPETSDFGIPP